jgi:glycosyltransferase EpsF
MRICHVVSTLDIGGIERWLLNSSRQMKQMYPAEFDIHVVVLLGKCGSMNRDFAAIGCRIHEVEFSFRELSRSMSVLRGVFAEGRFDVVHSHLDYLGGVVLPIAKGAGCGMAINHVHNTRFAFDTRRHPFRWAVGRVLRRRCLRAADLHLGCSRAALDAFIRGTPCCGPGTVYYCATPLDSQRPLGHGVSRAARDAMGVGEDAHLVTYVGRHTKEKNLFFLLEVFEALLHRDPSAVLAVAGSGPLSAELKKTAVDKGIAGRVKFIGMTDEVARLLWATDLFVLPSLYEGLPVSVVEAQAAGVPCLIADHVTAEVEIVPGLVSRLPLSSGPEAWAEMVERMLNAAPPDRTAALAMVERSPFNLSRGTELLADIYRAAAHRAA